MDDSSGRPAPLMALIVLVVMAGCGRPSTVNLYIWSDYLAPDTLAAFEKQTGVAVRVSYFDSLETMESRMLTGHSGFDVVVPTGIFLQRQIHSGAYLALDKTKLPALANLDPAILAQVAELDGAKLQGAA